MAKLKLIISSLLILGTILSVSLFTVPTKKAKAYTIKPDHPRLLLTSEKLTRLKELAKDQDPILPGNQYTAEWQNVLDQAGEPLGTLAEENRARGMSSALAYQITGNVAYVNKVKAVMKSDYDWFTNPDIHLPEYPHTISGDDYRGLGHLLPLMYDWIYDQLTTAEKEKYIATMNKWADERIPVTCGVADDTDGQLGDARGLLFAGIATYPENFRATGLIGYAEDDCRLGRVKNRWYKNTLGGLWPAGANYNNGDLNYPISYIAPAYKSAMNRDYWQEVGYPNFAKEQLMAFIHLYTSAKTLSPYGEMQVGDTTLFKGYYYPADYDPVIVGLADYLAGTKEGEYAQYIYNNFPLIYNNGTSNRSHLFYFQHFIQNDPARPQKDYRTDNISTDYLAPGMVFGFSRSDWTSNATYIAIQGQWAGGFADHHNADAGSFQIMRKGIWLTREDTGYDGSEPTRNHNAF